MTIVGLVQDAHVVADGINWALPHKVIIVLSHKKLHDTIKSYVAARLFKS